MSLASRIGWGSLAGLFLVTFAIGTILIIIQLSGSNSGQSNYITCTQSSKVPNQQPKNGKVKGAQLAGYSPPQTVSSIACIDFKTGNGATAQASSLITVKYVGALASNGTIFDDSFDTGKDFTTSLSQVIPGWQIGVPGMKVGGIRRVFIPSALGYGSQASAAIPPNSDLIFDIQLVAVQ